MTKAQANRQRMLGLGLVVLSAVLALVALKATSDSGAKSRTVELGQGVKALDIDLTTARVQVLPSKDRTATIRVDGDDEAIDARASGGTAKVRCPAEDSCGTPKLVIHVPKSTDVSIALDRGAATVSRVTGAIAMQSTKATLKVFEARSPSVDLSNDSGHVYASLAGIAESLKARTTTGNIYLTVPYDYDHDGYDFTFRSKGRITYDMTPSRTKGVRRISAVSKSGEIAVQQRYPNMS